MPAEPSFTSVTRASSPSRLAKRVLAHAMLRASRHEAMTPAALEQRQPRPDNAAFNDSFYFMGMAPPGDEPFAFFARLGFRAERTETWFTIWTPETGLVDVGAQDVAPVPALEAAGLRFTCTEPGQRWALDFDGALSPIAGGDALPASFHADWTGAGPLYDYDEHTPKDLVARSLSHESWSRAFFEELQAMQQRHYEQVGRYDATLRLGGRERKLVLRGVRDHSFGPRRWEQIQGHCWLTAVLDDGTAFNLTLARMPRLHHVLRGYVMKDGRIDPVVDGPTLDVLAGRGRPPSEYRLWFTTASGRRFEGDVRLDGARHYRLGGALDFYEGIAMFDLGFSRGRGISEFSYNAG